jgi:GH43 family beta-xylosidase
MKTPNNTISNSDLELAGHIAHNNMLASLENIDSVTVASYTNNTLTVYWMEEGMTSTSIPAAYLLQLQAFHQQHYCYHSKTPHIAGTANVLADDCSRLWHLTDEQLLTHFSFNYPQNLLWKQCTL